MTHPRPAGAGRRSAVAAALVLIAAQAAVAQPAADAPPRAPWRDDGLFPDRGEGGSGGAGGTGEGGADRPAPLGPLMDALNPARLQRRWDEARERDTDRSDRPRGPELPLAVFVETVRPLGALRYENQLNYFVGTFTGDAPSLQTLTYEYVFADWNAARFELRAPRGRLESLGFGYQRTLGVGPDRNWAHGFLVLPEVAVNGSGFVGGSAFYTLGWKPEERSPWTVGLSAGANRASFANRPLGGPAGGPGSMALAQPGLGRADAGADREEEAWVWRPFAAGNLWYTASNTLTLGTEVDAYPHARFGEYLVLPNFTWRPVERFFVQFGSGYYRIAGQGQATFMCRVNLLNPSPRRYRDD